MHHEPGDNNVAEEGFTLDKLNAKALGIRKRTPANSRNASEAEPLELHTLLPTATYASGILATSEGTTYAASQEGDTTVAGTSTVIPTSTTPLGTHSPIPASVVFSRSAAPLYLPHLDSYLAGLPAPVFPVFLSKDKSKGAPMFPPMDRLAAAGRTLEDLEDNSEVAPWWRNRVSIFGFLTGWALALTVCSLNFQYEALPEYLYLQGSSALASFYSLHGLLDTIQIFALILNTIGKVMSILFAFDLSYRNLSTS